MDNAEVYARTRSRLLEVAAGLDDQQAARAVAACPGWTVKDAYAHLTGVSADIRDGRLEGAGSAEWTARQVAERAPRPLADVCDEWAKRGSELDEWLTATDPQRTTFVAFDVWSHEQDILATVGRAGQHEDLAGKQEDPQVGYLADLALAAFDRRFTEAGAPALRIVIAGGDAVDRLLGQGEPEATLRITAYELLRTLFGRRSLAQIQAADWDGNSAPYLDHLHLFALPEVDLVD
jgi:uncharacterized protein (TIGR03083 family)